MGKRFSDAQIRVAILNAVHARAPKTLCPSEVARSLASDEGVWRSLMADVREVAGQLVAEGLIIATQRGTPVDPVAARGPIRLART